jgi:hypothetical protein
MNVEPLLLSSLCWNGVEEAGCQACEQLSPGERVCWEVVFSQRESNTSYEALRILDPACCRDPEREVKHRWTVLVKVYTPRVEQACGE